MPQKLDWNI